jgi:hypothetical protein
MFGFVSTVTKLFGANDTNGTEPVSVGPPLHPNHGANETNDTKPAAGRSNTHTPPPSPNHFLREATLSWYVAKDLTRAYVNAKGQPDHHSKGYLCHCTLFADSRPPDPSIGEPMDIYMDTANNSIHAHLQDDWVQWEDLSEALFNPHLPKMKLLFQRTKGLTWAMLGAVNVERYRTKGIPVDFQKAIEVTLNNHPSLTDLPTPPRTRRLKKSNKRVQSDEDEEDIPVKKRRVIRRLVPSDEESDGQTEGERIDCDSANDAAGGGLEAPIDREAGKVGSGSELDHWSGDREVGLDWMDQDYGDSLGNEQEIPVRQKRVVRRLVYDEAPMDGSGLRRQPRR